MEFNDIFLLINAALIGWLVASLQQAKKQHKPQVEEVDEQVKRRAEQMERDFQELFNYDVTTAMQRKKVT